MLIGLHLSGPAMHISLVEGILGMELELDSALAGDRLLRCVVNN